MQGKLIIFTAPSGAGKTSIVKSLLAKNPLLSFSVSACTRPIRKNEAHGKDYYFISEKEFKNKIQNNEFIEWEEVYSGNYYGTLKSEVERIWTLGKQVVFDIDVKGAVNLKKQYPHNSISIFIKPPDMETLLNRLKQRGTESEETLAVRAAKATTELKFEKQFDQVIVNENLDTAIIEAEALINNFLKN